MFFFIFHYNHCYSNSISYCALFLNYINAQFKAATIFYAFIQSKYYKIYTSVTFRILFSCSPLITTKTGKRALLPYWPSTPVQPSMSKPSRQARPTWITVSHPLYPRNGRLKKKSVNQVSPCMTIFSISPEFWCLLCSPGLHYSRELWRFNQCSPWLKFSVRHQSAL